MAAIFPPADKGGIPPGATVVNGYTPTNAVIGEGPLYVAPDCTTVLTADQLNAITSEILAAVDKLGFSFNSGKITNLGDALQSLFDSQTASLGGKVNRNGDTMTGALALRGPPTDPLQAATKAYVDQGDDNVLGTAAAADTAIRNDFAAADTSIRTAFADADAVINAAKISKSGDTMTGALTLYGPPLAALQAATKGYVDSVVSGGGGGVTFVNRAGDTMTGTLIIKPASANASFALDKPAGAYTASIVGRVNGLLRWHMEMGNSNAEGTGAANSGCDWNLSAYGDAGGFLYSALSFARASGLGFVKGDPTSALGIATKQYVDGKNPIPSGTAMLFWQAAAPLGWTKQTGHHDKALRVTSGAGGGFGGSYAFSTVFAQTVTGNTTIDTNTMPSHTHQERGLYGAQDSTTQDVMIGLYGDAGRPGGGSFTSASGGGAAHSHPLTMAIQYIDVIICAKD